MKSLTLALLCAVPFTFGACKSTGSGSMTPQEVVIAVAGNNDSCTRLTLHCVQADGSTKVCASTDAARVGKNSDPEDLRAMKSGETVVLDENGGVDVTVPLLMTDGKWTTVCGVTMAAGMDRKQAVDKANAIAMAVKSSLGDCCANCCK